MAKSSATNSYAYQVKGNATYRFTVRAADSSGDGTCSAATAALSSTQLAAPTGLSVTRAVNAFTITWNARSGASIYHLFTTGGACSGKAKNVSGTSYTMTARLANPYNFAVRAVTAKKNLGVCSSGTGARYVLPAAPTLSSVTIGTNGTTRSLSWSIVALKAKVATYTVYRSTTSSSSGFQSIASGLSATKYVEASACPGAVCYYKVVASAHGDNSADSNVLSSWTPVSPGGGAPTLSLGSGFANQPTTNLAKIVDGDASLPPTSATPWTPPSYTSPSSWSTFDGEIIYDYGAAKSVSSFQLANVLTCGSTLNVTIYRYAAGSWTQIATGSYSFASVLLQSSTINFTQATDTKFKVRFATTCAYSSYWGFSIYEAKLN